MFKALERHDSGKIELDMQQVSETISQTADAPTAHVLLNNFLLSVFSITVAVPSHLLALEAPGYHDRKTKTMDS